MTYTTKTAIVYVQLDGHVVLVRKIRPFSLGLTIRYSKHLFRYFSMKRTLTRIAPFQAALVAAVVYACLSLIFVPFFLVGSFLGGDSSLAFGIGFSVAFPFLYAIMGFIMTLIMCGIYNFVVKYTGGIEVEVARDEPTEPHL